MNASNGDFENTPYTFHLRCEKIEFGNIKHDLNAFCNTRHFFERNQIYGLFLHLT